MRIIALEEHMATPEVIEAWRQVEPRWRDVGFQHSSSGRAGDALLDLNAERLAAMDESDVDVQVLSLTTPGVQNLEAADATRLQTQVNDLLAHTVSEHPDRFQAFAMLATPDPAAAAKELERVVTTSGSSGAMLFGRLDRWMKSVSRAAATSQRKASAIEAKGGGIQAAARAARAAGVHLVLLTDDKGVELVDASRHPFKVIA